ncbi:hypothetical protein PG987_009721 [Apiospora arundinis]
MTTSNPDVSSPAVAGTDPNSTAVAGTDVNTTAATGTVKPTVAAGTDVNTTVVASNDDSSTSIASMHTEDLPLDLQIPILLEKASAIPAHKRIHWGPHFHSHLPATLQQAINSDNLSVAAIDTIYRNYDFVVKDEPYKPGTMAPAPRFLDAIVPPQGLAALSSLSIDFSFSDDDWRRVAWSVAPKLKSLRSMTIVARYETDETIYNFSSSEVLNQLCTLVNDAVWPMSTLGHQFDQLIVHVHSGAGSWLAGRDPRVEPTYFFERAEMNRGKSLGARVHDFNKGIVRETPREGFVEGMVSIASTQSNTAPEL